MSGEVEKGEHVYLIRSNSFQLRIIIHIYVYMYVCIYIEHIN